MPTVSSPYPAAFAPTPDQIVTSSNLVRHFGLWQERAAREPVYVLLHGRPRLALLALETFTTLCAQASPNPDPSRLVDVLPLLDTIGDIVLIADADGKIMATSRAARLHFGAMAAPGQPLVGIAPVVQHPSLAEAIGRVATAGTEEALRLRSIARTGRVLAVTLIPFQRGVALVGRDETLAQDHARLCAIEQATAEAMMATGGTALVLLDRSGQIAPPAAALTLMIGTSADALRATPLPALVALPQRATVAQAIDRVFATHRAETIDAALTVSHDRPLKVRMGLAPVWDGGDVERIVAMVCAR